MKKLDLISTVLFLLIILTTLSYADVPKLINYQGHLTDKGGNPLTGTYSITFTIYDADTGGNNLWSETQSSVSVKNGLFSILLGSATLDGIPESVFDSPDRWLGVTIAGDSEVSPRQQLVSVPYAYKAGHVDTTLPPEPVPKTGQTTCYDSEGNVIECAGTGQDGEYQKGVDRFTDNGDGTVTDKFTGLMWTKDAKQIPGTMNWQAALTTCNDLVYAGYTDWRLPNVYELQSLTTFMPVRYPFINLYIDFYWSSTTREDLTAYAWLVRVGGGGHLYHLKPNDRDVWPVRGGQ